MRMTFTRAKNQLGTPPVSAKREPECAEKATELEAVDQSTEHCQALQINQGKGNSAVRRKVFEAEFGDWIATQNIRFEAQGIPGADLRPW